MIIIIKKESHIYNCRG